jgi:hypothetical protein
VRSQRPYFARGLVLVQELHTLHSAAQALLGPFARLNSPQPIGKISNIVIGEPTAAVYY